MEERRHLSHGMRQTSLKAYDKVARLGDKQREVFVAIHKSEESMTDREIARFLGYADPNKVRPRRYELMKLGLIEEDETRDCQVSGKSAITWKSTLKIEQQLGMFYK